MRHSLATILLVGLATSIAGCGPSKTQEALIQKESAPYRQRGNSSIAGRAFLVAPDGHQIPASMEEVYLTPVTTWSEGRVAEVVASNKIPSGSDRAAAVWWTTRADSSGGFSFEELPAGEYFVICGIAFSHRGDAVERVAYARVMVAPGQVADVEVKRQIEGA
jgi:hypothetical protein